MALYVLHTQPKQAMPTRRSEHLGHKSLVDGCRSIGSYIAQGDCILESYRSVAGLCVVFCVVLWLFWMFRNVSMMVDYECVVAARNILYIV